MNRHSTLLARLRRIEARHRPAKAMPPRPVVFAIADAEGPMIGAGSLSATLQRRYAEDESSFLNRAFSTLETRIVHALYDEGIAHVAT